MKAFFWLVACALLLWMGVPYQVLVGGAALFYLGIFVLTRSLQRELKRRGG